MNTVSPLRALSDIPTLMAKPCVFMTESSQLLRLTETELWALLDEIGQWRSNGRQGQLSEQAQIVLTSRNHSARCWNVFHLWQMQTKAAVC
jgi:hypothetical protein